MRCCSITSSAFPIDFATVILASAEVFDPDTGSWSATGSMAEARVIHTTTLLRTGHVLAVGGAGSDQTSLPSAELYNPRVLVSAPVLFSLTGNGPGQGAIWHAATGQAASANNPAGAGEILSM